MRDQQRAERDAYRFLDDEIGNLAASLPGHIRLKPIVTFGAPARAIVARANAVDAELIVMGRGSARALRDVFLGSTAERVVRGSSRPVLVVRLPARRSYERPAIALDLEPAAHNVVAMMLRVLPVPRPAVHVIHAFDPYHGMRSLGLTDDAIEHRRKELAQRATLELSRMLAASLARAKVAPREAPTWRYHVDYGSPRITIEKAVARDRVDLLVLGTHGRKGFTHMLLGSVAGDVLREVPCDVLVVPPNPGAAPHP